MVSKIKKYLLWFAVIDFLVLALLLFLFLPQNYNNFLMQGLLIPKDDTQVDIAIVLGAGLKPNGTVSDLARERVDYALSILKDQKVDIIFSGGETSRGIEAVAMNKHAKANDYTGLDHIEASSHSTYENAFFSDKLLDQDRFKDDVVLVITSPYHAKRAKAVFEKVMPEREIKISYPDNSVVLIDNISGRLRGGKALIREYLAGAWYRLRYGI